MSKAIIKNTRVSAYTIPTEFPESDGTLEWNSTTLVLVEIEGGGKKGIGYTYGDVSVAGFIYRHFIDLLSGKDALQLPAVMQLLIQNIRNSGNSGIAYMAVSAVDCALWDLKAKILDLPLASLLGMAHNRIRIYGSGGFTSYPVEKLSRQLSDWSAQGIRQVKMKIGRDPDNDLNRIRAARSAISKDTELFVDANGAYDVKQALEKAFRFAEYGVTWFEEPVSGDNLGGLHYLQQHAPPGMHITAGEYGYELSYFTRMIAAGAVDVLQADATRCGGISGFLKAGYLCEANHTLFSFHCAPSLHLQAATALPSFYTGEYFYDHARIEQMLFDGAPVPEEGYLKPGLERPGLGLTFRFPDAEKYKAA